MDLRSLRYFIGVLEAGSLSRAAGSLYIAQPALTARIKKLEGELGVKLFERSHAGVTPTLAGLQLYEDAQRLLSDADALRERMRRLPDGPEGSVTIAMPFLIAEHFSARILMRARQMYPRIRIFILDGLSLEVRQAMLDGRADIGVVTDTASGDGLTCRPLGQGAVYFCGRDVNGRVAKLLGGAAKECTRGYSATPHQPPVISFDDATQLPLLMQSRRYGTSRRVREVADERGVQLNIAYEHDSTRVIRSLLLAGAGFTFAPAWSLRASLTSSQDWIRARMVEPDLPIIYSLATTERHKRSEVSKAVLGVMEEEVHAWIQEQGWGQITD